MNSPNGKGPRANGAPLENTLSQGPKFSARSSHSEAQRQRILAALRRRPQTTEDLRSIGVFQVATRVKELRDRFNFDIETVRVTVVDRESYSHPRAALYVLHEASEAT